MLRRMCKDEEEPEILYTIREAARRLHYDETTVRRWIKEGILKAVMLPRPSGRKSYRVKKSTIDSILDDPPPPSL